MTHPFVNYFLHPPLLSGTSQPPSNGRIPAPHHARPERRPVRRAGQASVPQEGSRRERAQAHEPQKNGRPFKHPVRHLDDGRDALHVRPVVPRMRGPGYEALGRVGAPGSGARRRAGRRRTWPARPAGPGTAGQSCAPGRAAGPHGGAERMRAWGSWPAGRPGARREQDRSDPRLLPTPLLTTEAPLGLVNDPHVPALGSFAESRRRSTPRIGNGAHGTPARYA